MHDNYNDSTCYLSADGLSGFAITENGDLISVFNLNNKKCWLIVISTEVVSQVKTLDFKMGNIEIAKIEGNK